MGKKIFGGISGETIGFLATKINERMQAIGDNVTCTIEGMVVSPYGTIEILYSYELPEDPRAPIGFKEQWASEETM